MTSEKSTHLVEVVDIKPEIHPNAEKLSLVSVFDGSYRVAINTEQWQGITKGVFIPPENYVDTNREEFKFLAKNARTDGLAKVKPIKLRGIVSQGILIPYSSEYDNVENLTEYLGVQHVQNEAEENEVYGYGGLSGITFSKYDIDGPKYFMKDFQEDWDVVATEKCDGQNTSYYYQDETLYVKGRTQYLSFDSKHNAYIALSTHHEIEQFCKSNQNLALYGEVYGFQTPYTYGLPPGHRKFIAFDIRNRDGSYWDYDSFLSACQKFNIPTCPEIYRGKWNHEKLQTLSLGKSLIGGSLPKEGIVIRPIKEKAIYGPDKLSQGGYFSLEHHSNQNLRS